MKHSQKMIDSVLKEFYREKRKDEDRKDISNRALSKATGLSYQTIGTILKNHFEDKERNPPMDLDFDRECTCYRRKELCRCEIKEIK